MKKERMCFSPRFKCARIVKMVFLLCCLLSAYAAGLHTAHSDDRRGGTAFLPSWRLLNPSGKLQFTAGYLHAWRDAVDTLDIAINFVEEHPQRAADSLKSLRRLYDFGNITPNPLVREIDSFYNDPKNSNAPYSKAITAARNKIGR